MFVFLEQPQTDPLVFMQSLDDPGLCFIAVSVFVADRAYELTLSDEDRLALGLSSGEEPAVGKQIFCLALVTTAEGSAPTVNLAAPIVLNTANARGCQSVQGCTGYSFQHPLGAEEPLSCS